MNTDTARAAVIEAAEAMARDWADPEASIHNVEPLRQAHERALDTLIAAVREESADVLQVARGALADIASSSGLTIAAARRKAARIYVETMSEEDRADNPGETK